MSYDMYMGLIRSAFYTFYIKITFIVLIFTHLIYLYLFNGQGKKKQKTEIFCYRVYTIIESKQLRTTNAVHFNVIFILLV